MNLCVLLFLLYLISILVATFSAFSLNMAMKGWIEAVGSSAQKGIVELSESTTESGLSAFKSAFLLAAVCFIVLSMVFRAFKAEIAADSLSLLSFVMLFCWLSVRAWVNNRKPLFTEFLERAKTEAESYIKVFVAIAAIAVGIAAFAANALGESLNGHYGSIAVFIVGGLFLAFALPFAGNSFSLIIIFAPALVALAYLWLAIFVAKGVRALGGRTLKNLLVVYSIGYTAYLAVLSLPTVKQALHLPLFCQ